MPRSPTPEPAGAARRYRAFPGLMLSGAVLLAGAGLPAAHPAAAAPLPGYNAPIYPAPAIPGQNTSPPAPRQNLTPPPPPTTRPGEGDSSTRIQGGRTYRLPLPQSQNGN